MDGYETEKLDALYRQGQEECRKLMEAPDCSWKKEGLA